MVCVSLLSVSTLCRYLLDNPGLCRGKMVLDLGSGCGASAIAAKLCGATYVVANDIDTGKTTDIFIHSLSLSHSVTHTNVQLTNNTKQTTLMC